ncbi:MAG: zinc carboxypeptidase [Elusimicrobia bacterium]|nr:zinc carboxypeptidase [Elusimicrobiota bacterium]
MGTAERAVRRLAVLVLVADPCHAVAATLRPVVAVPSAAPLVPVAATFSYDPAAALALSPAPPLALAPPAAALPRQEPAADLPALPALREAGRLARADADAAGEWNGFWHGSAALAGGPATGEVQAGPPAARTAPGLALSSPGARRAQEPVPAPRGVWSRLRSWTGRAKAWLSGKDAEQRVWVELLAATREARSAIAETGAAIEEVVGGRVGAVATRAELKLLEALQLPLTALGLDRVLPRRFPDEDAEYHDYDEVQAGLRALAAAAPDLASLVELGASLEGRKITGIRLNASAKGTEPSAKPGIVFLGTHHAREHLSTEVALRIPQWLVANRAKPEVQALLAGRDVYFVPMVNPDGAEFDHSKGRYLMHRKNMRRNPNGTVGVDLNRNYSYKWGTGGASGSPGSDTYRGPNPFSEPETQAVRDFVSGLPNVRILLSYHTFSELILYPWGHTYDPIQDARALEAYRAMARKMAAMTGYAPQQSSELYIASGDTTDWAWGEKGIFSFTFELTPASMGQGGFYPGAKAIPATVERNIAPALYLIDLADDPYRAAASKPTS